MLRRAGRRVFSSARENVISLDNPYTLERIATSMRVPSDDDVASQFKLSQGAYQQWRGTGVDGAVELCNKFCEKMSANSESIAKDITDQMGKPFREALGEVNACIDRARTMIALAPGALARQELAPKGRGEYQAITREPIGPVLCLSPWNYPLLCAVNVVIPAVLAGNSVLLKHSSRTPLCSEHFQRCFEEAGAIEGLVQSLPASHSQVAKVINDLPVAFVAFTGSVEGGRQIQQAAGNASKFIDTGLELGGKDPAYVAADANLKSAAAGVASGALYNAGQSCCAVERVYVHASIYDEFLNELRSEVDLVASKMGDPHDKSTAIGPMAQANSVAFLKSQVDDAVTKGAALVTGGSPTTDKSGKGRFFQPTLLGDCTHDMSVVMEESFGPLCPVVKVESDEDAVQKMNDSPFGLTASIFTSDRERALSVGSQINTGTVFHNRCDVLDPRLPWSGRGDSGKGITLSHLGFHAFARTKSYNFASADA